MRRPVHRALLAGLLLVGLAVADSPTADAADRDLRTPKTPWSALAPQDQEILSPLAAEWDNLPGYQQQRLRSAARQYPKMQPIQQERFHERIRGWAAMTPEQRKAARETFQGMQRLPPEKQHELKERWLRKQEKALAPSAPAKEP